MKPPVDQQAAADVSAEDKAQWLRGLRNLQRGVGEVAMLLAGHEAYKGMFWGDVHRVVVPAVLCGQYRVIRNKQDRTIAYASWARVSEEVHKRLMQGRFKLQTADWTSGELLVVMDVAAPGMEAGARVLRELKTELFANENMWIIKSDARAHEPKLMLYRLPESSGDGKNA